MAGLGLLALGCSGASATPEVAPGAERQAQYNAGESALFGDTIAVDFFGLDRDTPPDEDPKLRARASAADSVVPARISTVTSDVTTGHTTYQLVLVPTGPALTGHSLTQPVSLELDTTSPSFAWIQAADTQLVGRAVILFAKRYNQQGVMTLHWHIETDTPAVRQAITGARALTEVGS